MGVIMSITKKIGLGGMPIPNRSALKICLAGYNGHITRMKINRDELCETDIDRRIKAMLKKAEDDERMS